MKIRMPIYHLAPIETPIDKRIKTKGSNHKQTTSQDSILLNEGRTQARLTRSIGFMLPTLELDTGCHQKPPKKNKLGFIERPWPDVIVQPCKVHMDDKRSNLHTQPTPVFSD